jgi:hypothetical protein
MAIGLLILFIISCFIGYYIILLLRQKSKNNLETINKLRLFDEKQNNFIYQFTLLMLNIGFINKAKGKLTIRFTFPGKDSEFIEKDYTSFISDINKYEKEQKVLLKDIKREVEKIPINISNDFSNFIAQNARKEGILEALVFVEGILATLIIGLIVNLIRLSGT